jgi:RNA polymerase sigma-70 factor (ECF subfamily)
MRDAARLYDRYGPALYRYALMLLADPASAEDAVQQVFASVLKQRGGAVIENDEHYLRRAIRNECYSTLRRRQGLLREDAANALLEDRTGADVSIEDRLTLEKAIGALPAEQRETVHLHLFEGLTFREIAEMAGESINTVASRYRYALTAIRKHFDR